MWDETLFFLAIRHDSQHGGDPDLAVARFRRSVDTIAVLIEQVDGLDIR